MAESGAGSERLAAGIGRACPNPDERSGGRRGCRRDSRRGRSLPWPPRRALGSGALPQHLLRLPARGFRAEGRDCVRCCVRAYRTGYASVPRSSLRQGSGRLETGATVSFAKRGCGCAAVCPRTSQQICFERLDPARFPHGRGATGHAITPLRSIAVDSSVIPLGTAVHIPELVGLPESTGRRTTAVRCRRSRHSRRRPSGGRVHRRSGHDGTMECAVSLEQGRSRPLGRAAVPNTGCAVTGPIGDERVIYGDESRADGPWKW